MFVPEKGNLLTIDLPGEKMRATVVRKVSRNIVVVEIDGMPIAKSHSFRTGDVVTAKREETELGEVWRVEEERRTVALPPDEKHPR